LFLFNQELGSANFQYGGMWDRSVDTVRSYGNFGGDI